MEFICHDDYRPLLPDGVYVAQCVKHDSSFVLGKARKLFLHFVILEEGKWHGEKLFEAFNVPYDMRIKAGSKYYKTWAMVNGWMRPSKNAKMSTRLFVNKIFRIKTRTVKPKHNEKMMPEHFWYSVIDEILEVVAG